MKKKKSKQIKWDEHMVIAVIVASALCVLILLAGFISSTGHATYTGLINTENVIDILSTQSTVIDGTGRMKCTFACSNIGMYSIISYADFGNEDLYYAENNEVTNADQYFCLCSNN